MSSVSGSAGDTPHLAGYLETAADRDPGRPAVSDPDGRMLTYGQLEARAARVAGFLVRSGVRPGDRVGLLLQKDVDAVTAIFGVLKAGAAYVPVDWTAPAHRCRSIFADCAVTAILVDGSRREVAEEWPGGGPPPIHVTVQGNGDAVTPGAAPWNQVLDHPPLARDAIRRGPDRLAYILYTSGSTGRPKGVKLTHRNATSFVDWCSAVFRPTPADRFSSHAPFHFDLSVFDLYVALKHGASVHLIPDDLGKNPRDLARFAADRRLTVWYSTPSVLSLLAQFGGIESLAYDGPRLGLFAGEVFPVRYLRRITAVWNRAEWYNLYGPTETNVCTSARIRTPVPPDRTRPYPIGDMCAHCRGIILDEEGQPVEDGEEGVLHVAGTSVFDGYWNRPDLDARAFRDLAGLRYYDTGDVVRRDPVEGLIYLGRKDRMVKRRGYRIELGEIETALYRHPQLRQVAVVAVPAPDEGVRLLACVVARDERPSIIALKQFCAAELPSYMSPDAFRFLEDLPRTSTDKTDYQRLLRDVRADAPPVAVP